MLHVMVLLLLGNIFSPLQTAGQNTEMPGLQQRAGSSTRQPGRETRERSGICPPAGTGWALKNEDRAAGGVGRGEPGKAMDKVRGPRSARWTQAPPPRSQRELPGTRGRAQWEGQRSTQS